MVISTILNTVMTVSLVILVIAAVVSALLLLFAPFGLSSKLSRQEEAQERQSALENAAVSPARQNPSHDPEPCPAIQEAQRRLADMPQVVAVSSHKMTRIS